jgi:hypothetical protein
MESFDVAPDNTFFPEDVPPASSTEQFDFPTSGSSAPDLSTPSSKGSGAGSNLAPAIPELGEWQEERL